MFLVFRLQRCSRICRRSNPQSPISTITPGGCPTHSRIVRMNGRGVLLFSLNFSTGRALNLDRPLLKVNADRQRSQLWEVASGQLVVDHWTNGEVRGANSDVFWYVCGVFLF